MVDRRWLASFKIERIQIALFLCRSILLPLLVVREDEGLPAHVIGFTVHHGRPDWVKFPRTKKALLSKIVVTGDNYRRLLFELLYKLHMFRLALVVVQHQFLAQLFFVVGGFLDAGLARRRLHD